MVEGIKEKAGKVGCLFIRLGDAPPERRAKPYDKLRTLAWTLGAFVQLHVHFLRLSAVAPANSQRVCRHPQQQDSVGRCHQFYKERRYDVVAKMIAYFVSMLE